MVPLLPECLGENCREGGGAENLRYANREIA
jgi:hypothetical protein